MQRISKIGSIVFLPIFFTIWVIGWTLSYFYSQKTFPIDIPKEQSINQKIRLKDNSEQETVQQEILA